MQWDGGRVGSARDLKIGALCTGYAIKLQFLSICATLPAHLSRRGSALLLSHSLCRTLAHLDSLSLSLSLSLFVQCSRKRVCCVECASVLCNLLVLCPLICVVYLTQMPHKNNKQNNNNNRESFMHMQSPHTYTHAHTHRRTAALCINVRGAATYAGVAWCINLALKCMQHIYICTLHTSPTLKQCQVVQAVRRGVRVRGKGKGNVLAAKRSQLQARRHNLQLGSGTAQHNTTKSRKTTTEERRQKKVKSRNKRRTRRSKCSVAFINSKSWQAPWHFFVAYF